MSLSEETACLRRLPLFGKVEESHLKLLSFASQRVSFMAGETFIRQGEPATHAFVMMDGTVDVLLDAGDGGGARIINTIAGNQVIGEIGLLAGGRRTASCRARTAVTGLKLDATLFLQLVRASPEFAIGIMRELAQRLDRSTTQLRDALSAAAETPA